MWVVQVNSKPGGVAKSEIQEGEERRKEEEEKEQDMEKAMDGEAMMDMMMSAP